MTPELAYFLKINVAIALFYAFYRLFFHKDTFFHWRRTALLCFFGISLLYPLLNIQEWIKEQEPMVAMADLYATIILPEQIIEAPQETTVNWQELIPQILGFIYWTGVLLLALRFLIQLGSIIRLHFLCPKSTIQGSRIHILKKGTGPFSFFHWIFIHPESHTESEISEIITHEETHARQYHSADVLVSEIMCTFCWFNPFVWLMKREVRGNLEYMADHRVLETGHDSKSYQYHLLGLAHHKAAANLSNSFNVLPLKNRIKMMNKRRTKEIGRTKYLMFLPLAALLMIISNIEVVARTTKEFAKEMMAAPEEQGVSQTELANGPELPDGMTGVATLQDKKGTQKTKEVAPPPPPAPVKSATVNDSVVFEVVEKMPEFPGGQSALMEYLAKNMKYPVDAQEAGVQGRIIVSFIVRKDGSITDIKTVRGVSPSLDKEAERVVAAMPKWIPGTQRGQAVNVKFTVPLMFRLSGPEPAKAEEAPQAMPINASDISEIFIVGYASKEEETIADEPTFKTVEEMPKFPGGPEALHRYLARNIKYPTMAQKHKEQGQVVIQMVIGKDGNISNIKVLKSVSAWLDAEAIRVIRSMPKWEPGKQDGKTVAVEYTLPMTFRLQ